MEHSEPSFRESFRLPKEAKSPSWIHPNMHFLRGLRACSYTGLAPSGRLSNADSRQPRVAKPYSIETA